MGTEVVFLILLSFQVFAGESWVMPPNLLDTVHKVKNKPMGQRISQISYQMRGKKYITDPVGEDRPPDRDPMVRYDAYDCLTFVEEVLALAQSADPKSAFLIRNAFRYRSTQYSYKNRNHFMISQWFPNAIEKGLLVDITSQFGTIKTIKKSWKPRIWNRWIQRGKFHLNANEFPLGRHSIDVVSLDEAIAAIPKLPEGAILFVVRANHRHNPIVITHLGFVVYRHNKPRFRHATKMGKGMIRDDSLFWYLNHLKSFIWTVEGVAILLPQEQGPRRIIEPNLADK